MKRDVLLLLLLFAVAIAIVDPRGNFPLDDDWDFALATWQFARSGHFAFTTFTATSLYAQVVWGAVWTWLFGASFVVLRASTLFLAAATLVVFCALLARLPLTRWQRFAAAASLLFHPIFFWSSFTYMTHVPFVFCTVLAIYCYMRGWTLGGSTAVIISFFIRQTGVVTAIGPMIVARDRRARLMASIPVVVFAIALPLLQHGEFGFHARPGQAPFHGALYLFDHFCASAVFTLPLLVPALGALRNRTIVVSAMAFFIARALLFIGFANPAWNPILTSTHLFGNIFINLGLGPPTLVDTQTLGLFYPLHLPRIACVILTMVSAAAGGALVALLIENARRDLGWLLVVSASSVLALSQLWFDRYALDATWALCFLLPLWRANSRTTFVLLIVFAIFDVFAVHDYMQWNRDRTAAWNELVARGVSPAKINGGVELNAMARDAFARPRPDWIIRNDYVLSFNRIDGYDVVARHGRVYTLVRRRATRVLPISTKWR